MLAFGTDGVRGDTRSELTEDRVEALGRAAAEVLGAERFAIGRDPRSSGPALVAALGRGVAAAGGVPVDLGVLPTPAVARWCEDEGSAGAMVSASHNPWHDNGVKLFATGGRKLDDNVQDEIERGMRGLVTDSGGNPGSADAGAAASGALPEASESARLRHLQSVISSIEGRDLAGLRLVVDCANGAASVSGPECLR